MSKSARHISRGTPDDNTTSSTPPKLDPLALVLCASAGPPAWVTMFDPMLEELAASLVVSQSTGAVTPECLPT
jgi:hypothetical protein